MSVTSYVPKFAPVKSRTIDKYKFTLPKSGTIPQTLVPIWLKILVLTCQYDTIKKALQTSNENSH